MSEGDDSFLARLGFRYAEKRGGGIIEFAFLPLGGLLLFGQLPSTPRLPFNRNDNARMIKGEGAQAQKVDENEESTYQHQVLGNQ